MLSIAEWTDRALALSSPMKLTSSASFSPSIRISLRLKIHQAHAKNFCRVLEIRVSHVMKSFVRAMKKVLVAGDKVKVDGLGIFYTTLTCPGVEQEKDCTVKNISRVNLRFKVDNSLRLANDSTATTRGGENNVSFELYTEKKAASEGEGGGSGSEEPGKGEGGSGGGVTPDPSI